MWYLTDRLGTVRDLADADGAIVNHIGYDSFGAVLSQTNAALGDRFLFTGREFDDTLGLYYYRARWYDPLLGRFLSQDPIGFAGGQTNLYAYVGNSPLMYTDPTGLLAAPEYSVTQSVRQGLRRFIEHWIECMFISILTHSVIGVVAEVFGTSYEPTAFDLGLDAALCAVFSIGPARAAARAGRPPTAGGGRPTSLRDHLRMFLRDEAGTMPLSPQARQAMLAERRALLQGGRASSTSVSRSVASSPQARANYDAIFRPSSTPNGPMSRTTSMVRTGGQPEVIMRPMSGATPIPGSRQTGIDRAWALETELVQRTGAGTAPWTPAEITRIQAGATYGDLGVTGHHINRVADYPAWAGDPRNIAFLRQGSGQTHMTIGHPGGTRAPQPEGYLIDRQAMLDLLTGS
jgi:RHS repeat-associated protein